MLDTDRSYDGIRHKMREIAQDVLEPAAADIDRQEAYPFGHARLLARAGINGMTIPVAYGGQGADFWSACIAVREASKVCGISGRIIVDTNMGAVPAIMAYGTDAQKRRTAELVLDGDKPAICFTEEHAGSDALAMRTRAVRHGDGYVLNGTKYWITGAGITKLYVVIAHVEEDGQPKGVGAFLIEDATDGLRVGDRIPAMGLRGIPEGYLHLEDCFVPADALLVPPRGLRKGFAQIMQAYNSQRIGAASVALGIAEGAYALTQAYMLERQQFSRPIAEFQGLQWKLADMSVDLRAAALLIEDTARASDPFPDVMQAAQAKIFTSEMAVRVTNAALQMHGAQGYSRDLPLERMVRDARMFTIGGGTTEILRNMVAGHLLGRKLPQTRDGYGAKDA